MDRLREATKAQLRVMEKRMDSLAIEDGESLKMLDVFREVISNRSQQEGEWLKSQIELLQPVVQNKMSIDELQEAFDKQSWIAEKRHKMFQDRKELIQGDLNNIIKLGNLLLEAVGRETKNLESYYAFLSSGHQIVQEEILAQTDQSKRLIDMEIAADLRLSNQEMDRKIDTLKAKRIKLKEEDVSFHDEIVDNYDAKFEDESGPVCNQNLMDVTKIKKSSDEFWPGPVTQIIQIDDDSTEVSCYSEEGEEVSSGVSTTQTSIKAKGARKQPPQLRTRCNQAKLCLLLSSFKGEKTRVIENSIFKPFLSIPQRSICLSFLQAFIERYNVRTDSFTIDKKAMRFCGKEVEACLGLKYEGRLVDFTTQVKRTPEVIKKYFGIEGRITKDSLMEKLKQMHVNKENADDFFRLLVYYMFSVYFFSTADAYISYWPVRYLEDLERFASFGWGRAVYQYLMESVRRAANECAEKVSSSTYIKGCLPLLETLVYERVGSCYLRVEVDPRFSHPSIIKYAKGDSRNPSTMRKVLERVKFDKIKDCEDCMKEVATPIRKEVSLRLN